MNNNNINNSVKPFSESISSGQDISGQDISESSINTSPDSYQQIRSESLPSDVTIDALKNGKDFQEKLDIYLNRAGIVPKSPRWWAIIKDIRIWKDKNYLQHEGFDSNLYNKELLSFLQNKDLNYLTNVAIEGKEDLPPHIRKYLSEKVGVNVPYFGIKKGPILKKRMLKPIDKESLPEYKRKWHLIREMNISPQEQDQIYSTPGIVPPWWWTWEPEGIEPPQEPINAKSYTYHAAKAIEKLNISARDVQLAVERVSKIDDISKVSNNDRAILVAGWGSEKAEDIMKSKLFVPDLVYRKYGEHKNNVIPKGNFYHKDVGWY